jgi:Transposase DDE domain group 1
MPTDDDTGLPFSLPSVCKKKVTAAFDVGQISSDGGVLLLAGADKRLGLIDTLATLIPDDRDPALITHSLSDILRARVFAIACGYPDADDLDDLRKDPAFKLACGRLSTRRRGLPESGNDLASQPTMSRWENAPDRRTLIRMSHAMVDVWCKRYRRAPKAITLDIDDTDNVVHGHQQLSLFNAYHDERCFMPLHVYDAASGHCVLTVLRPGKTPSGQEVRAHLRRLVHRIRLHWPKTIITIRGDSHYGRHEAMAWCEQNGVQYVFGLERNAALAALVQADIDAVEIRWANAGTDVVRDYAETLYAAGTWSLRRRVVARIEATYQGLDTRYVVTNIGHCGGQWLYDSLYCARGQAENLIKWHKSHLASDRTSCRSPLANQMRLVLHTAAYWLMLEIRNAIPRPQPLASGEFATIRRHLLKIAVRIRETASRVRLAFAANCTDAALFRGLVGTLILRPT